MLINYALNSITIRLIAVDNQDFTDNDFINIRDEQDSIFNNLTYYISKLML